MPPVNPGRFTDVKRMATETAASVRSSVEVMDQADEAEKVVKTLARMIEEKRLFVRVYTKGRLHAKAYIFNYGQSYDLFGNIQPKIERALGSLVHRISRCQASATTPN